MVRIMLALLALLGFAAHGVPAQARLSGSGGAEVGSVEVRPAAVRAVIAARPDPLPINTFMAAAADMPRRYAKPGVVPVPTVRLRIDRSHE